MDLGIYNPQDFLQRYGDCIVKIWTKKGTEFLFQIIKTDNTNINGFLLKKEGWVPRQFKLENITMDTSVPDLGAINVEGGVALISRKVQKQYRHSFNFKNSVINSSVVEYTTHTALGYAFRIKEPSVVKEIFYPKYVSVHKAIGDINTKKAVARAISSRYYIACSNIVPFLYLGFAGNIVGKINENTGDCTLFEQTLPLKEDLQQYINVV